MTLRFCVLILLVSTLFSLTAYAQVYRYVDEQGKVVYASVKPAGIEQAEQINLRPNSVATPELAEMSADKDVVIYTTTWCGYCKRAKSYFEQQGIAYEEYDIEKSTRGKRDYAGLRGNGVPIILVGEQRMDGFDKSRFDKLYTND